MARTAEEHIPQSAAELTPEWFSEVLPFSGDVTAVRIDTIGAGVGFMGEVHRCHLTWTGAGDDVPVSVIVKVPTAHPTNFALGDGLKIYEREIVVYRDFRDSLGVPMPEHLYSAMDPDPAPWLEPFVLFLFSVLPIRAINWVIRQFLKLAGRSKRRYLLVIEDFADARPPEQTQGGSVDDAAAALGVLARFHATNWMRFDVPKRYRRIGPINRTSRAAQAGYVRNRESFVERFGEQLGSETMTRLDDIQSRIPDLYDELAADPWTVLHGDFRLDNVLFRPNGEMVVLDFQSLGLGRPAMDVAYFITTALTIEHREHEERLLHVYHDALVASGVTSYSYDMLTTDCGRAKEAIAHAIVGAADIIDTEIAGDAESFMDVIQLRTLDWID